MNKYEITIARKFVVETDEVEQLKEIIKKHYTWWDEDILVSHADLAGIATLCRIIKAEPIEVESSIAIKESYEFYLNETFCAEMRVDYWGDYDNIIHSDAFVRNAAMANLDSQHKAILKILKGDILFQRTKEDSPGHFLVSKWVKDGS